MPTFADINQTVMATLASKRVGKPVFVRLTWQGLDKPEAVVPRLAQIVSAVQRWLGQPLEQLYALGFAAGGQLSLTLRFREGATALISFERGQPRGDGLDLMVLGNHGAIYHDAGSAELWDETVTPPADPPDPALVALIKRAVHSRKPERPGEGGKP
jgi:dienelactone hydrolase